MTIETLVCKADGTQAVEQREVPDVFFTVPVPQPTTEEQLRADVDFLAIMTGVAL